MLVGTKECPVAHGTLTSENRAEPREHARKVIAAAADRQVLCTPSPSFSPNDHDSLKHFGKNIIFFDGIDNSSSLRTKSAKGQINAPKNLVAQKNLEYSRCVN